MLPGHAGKRIGTAVEALRLALHIPETFRADTAGREQGEPETRYEQRLRHFLNAESTSMSSVSPI